MPEAFPGASVAAGLAIVLLMIAGRISAKPSGKFEERYITYQVWRGWGTTMERKKVREL